MELKRLKVLELREIMSDLNIPGRSKITKKNDMIIAIQKYNNKEQTKKEYLNDPFESFPNELLEHILFNLEFIDIARFGMTNTNYERFIKNEGFWAEKSIRDFNYPKQKFINSEYGGNLSPIEKYKIIRNVVENKEIDISSTFSTEVSLYYYALSKDLLMKIFYESNRYQQNSIILLLDSYPLNESDYYALFKDSIIRNMVNTAKHLEDKFIITKYFEDLKLSLSLIISKYRSLVKLYTDESYEDVIRYILELGDRNKGLISLNILLIGAVQENDYILARLLLTETLLYPHNNNNIAYNIALSKNDRVMLELFRNNSKF